MPRYEGTAFISVVADSLEEAEECINAIASDRQIEHRIERIEMPGTNAYIELDEPRGAVELVDEEDS